MKEIFRFAALLLLLAPLRGSAITTAWIGGTGDWTDVTKWLPGVVPNNGFPAGSNTYQVTINSGATDVVNLLTQTIFLDSLTTGIQATLNVNDQGLQLGSAASTATLLANAGTLNFTNAATLALDFSGGASASSSGTIHLGDESEIFLQTSVPNGTGTLANSGTINMQSNPHGSQIFLQGGGAVFTIDGGGNLTMSDNAANLISGVLGTESLTTDNKISGAGTIGNLTNFTNNGTLTANGTNPLIVNMDYAAGAALLTGMVTNNGSMSVANGSALTLQGANQDFALVNNGTVAMNSTNFITQLVYNDGGNGHSLLLSGTGTLSLSDSGGNFVLGANGDEKLVNQLQHTITGAGVISGFGGGIVNNGTIVANGVNPLTIGINDAAVAHTPGITNNGLIQVNDGATLQILSSVGGTILNAGSITLNANTGTSTLSFNDLNSGGLNAPGTVLQIAGGNLTLSDNPGNRITGINGDEGLQINPGTTLSGAGTITNFGGYEALTNEGTIVANGRNPLILDGTAAAANTPSSITLCGCLFSALSNFGLVQVNDGSTFEIQSALGASIHNWANFAGPGGGLITLNALNSTSTLSFNSLGRTAYFTFDDNTSGTPGVLSLSDNPGNRIVGVSGFEQLANGDFHTIQGAGTINVSFLFNQGSIIANGTNPLIFESATKLLPSLSNQNLIQIDNGSTFEVSSNQPGQTTILNVGSITLNAATSTSTLSFNNNGSAATFALSGEGVVNMSDNAGNRITGATGTESLTILSGTIQGAGTISNLGGGLVNQGKIIASGINPLILDITAATQLGVAGFSNSGTVQINDGGMFEIRSGIGGTLLNNGSISLNSSVGTSMLTFNDLGQHQTFTINGTGDVVFSNSPSNRIMGVNGDEILINNSLIVGRGAITNFSQFINNGQLAANQGTLEVQAPLRNWNAATHTLTGGIYTAAIGSTLALSSLGSNTITNLNGAIVSNFGGIVTGDGSVNIFSNLTNLTNSTLNLWAAAIPASITPVGSSTLTLQNSLLTVIAGGSTTLNGSYSQDAASILDLGATTGPTAAGPLTTLNVTGDFMNQGTVTIGNAIGPAALTVGGTLTNSGYFEIGQGTNSVTAGTYIQTAGTTKVLAGAVMRAVDIDEEGGAMGGGGTFIGNVNVTGGMFAPGDPATSTVMGDFTLGQGGEILLEIAGIGDFDSLDIIGNLHLNGGTLDIRFIDGFAPVAGDSWNVLSFTGIQDGSGFSNIDFENAGGEQFTAFFSGQSFEFADNTGSVNAPEPSSLAMVSIAVLAGIGVFSRRRW